MRVTTYTATLELKTEKANAHSNAISSVAYSPDGSQILTGSWDKSLKVWEQRPYDESEWAEIQGDGTPTEGPFEGFIGQKKYLLKFPYWKNTITGGLEQQKPSGG